MRAPGLENQLLRCRVRHVDGVCLQAPPHVGVCLQPKMVSHDCTVCRVCTFGCFLPHHLVIVTHGVLFYSRSQLGAWGLYTNRTVCCCLACQGADSIYSEKCAS